MRIVVNAASSLHSAIIYGMAVALSNQQIVYTVAYGGTNSKGPGLYSAGVNNQRPRLLLDGAGKLGAAYVRGLAQGGSAVVVEYYDYLARPLGTVGSTTLALINLKTGSVVPIVPRGTVLAKVYPTGGAALSPDGSKLLYTYASPPFTNHLVLRDLRFGSEVQLPLNAGYQKTLTGASDTGLGLNWSRNGIIFAATTPHEGTIFHLTTKS